MTNQALRAQLKAWLAARPSDTDPSWLAWSENELAEFWQRTEHLEFKARDGVRICYGVWPQPEPSPWLILLPGRIEAYIKYQEVALEWAAKGYSVAIIDHRGQGFSDRLTDRHEHGHVHRFADYVHDIADWMEVLAPRIDNQPAKLLAHSMGAAIGALYLAGYAQTKAPFAFEKAMLCSPMMGINTKPWPPAIGKAVVRAGAWIKQKIAPERAHYFIAMKDYETLPFEENRLTHSRARYQFLSEQYHQHPRIRVGGPTWQWLTEALHVIDIMPKILGRIQIPVLLLQAGADEIVDLAAQELNAQYIQNVDFHVIKGSAHEILMETDAIRNRALALMGVSHPQ